MKNILFGLSILFTILTFIGAIYVLKSGGEMNAGLCSYSDDVFYRMHKFS